MSRSDGTDLRQIPLMTVSPEPGTLGVLAAEVMDAKLDRPFGALRDTDAFALDRLLRGLGEVPAAGSCSATSSSTATTSPPSSTAASALPRRRCGPAGRAERTERAELSCAELNGDYSLAAVGCRLGSGRGAMTSSGGVRGPLQGAGTASIRSAS